MNGLRASVARATRRFARSVCARSSRIARGTAQSAARTEAPLEQPIPIPHLREVVVFLVVAGLVVPPFRPRGGVRRLAGLGVIFLMFTFGPEPAFERLRSMRRPSRWLGGARAVLTAAAL